MLNQVSVLIPYKPDHGMRDELFNWVKKFYEDVMPEVELCIGESLSEPFNRSKAVNTAAKKATKDVFVIADADVIYNPKILIQAIEMLNENAWIVPYSRWLNLSNESTKKLLSQSPKWPLPMKVQHRDRFKNRAHKPVSGVIVVPRKNFEIVKGFDERFVGWGNEDVAFRDALNTLCGPYKRIENNFIFHLWHPKIGAKGNPNFKNNVRLSARYAERNGNEKEMKELIEERNDLSNTKD